MWTRLYVRCAAVALLAMCVSGDWLDRLEEWLNHWLYPVVYEIWGVEG